MDEIYTYHGGLDDGKTKAPVQAVLLPKECPACHLMKPPRVAVCPHCGHKTEAHAKPVAVERGTLRELKPKDDIADLRKKLPDKPHVFGQLWWWGKQKGFKPGWAAVKTKEIFGAFPRDREPDRHLISAPVPELLSYIYESQEKWKKQQNNARRKAQWSNGNGHANGHAMTERENAIIDRVSTEAKSMMSDQDWQDMEQFR